MPIFGYARVSSLDQNLAIQRAALKAAGCGLVRAEKASRSRCDNLTELQVLLTFVQPEDILVVTRVNRLALHERPAGHRPRTEGARRHPRAIE